MVDKYNGNGSQVQGTTFGVILGATFVLYTLNLQADVCSRLGFLESSNSIWTSTLNL